MADSLNTSLVQAVTQNDLVLAEKLVQDESTFLVDFLLMNIARTGSVDMVNLLLKHVKSEGTRQIALSSAIVGARWEIIDLFGPECTPNVMNLACSFGIVEVVQNLIEKYGLQLITKEDISHAVENNRVEVIQLIADYIGQPSPESTFPNYQISDLNPILFDLLSRMELTFPAPGLDDEDRDIYDTHIQIVKILLTMFARLDRSQIIKVQEDMEQSGGHEDLLKWLINYHSQEYLEMQEG